MHLKKRSIVGLIFLGISASAQAAANNSAAVEAPVSRSEFEELKQQLLSLRQENGDLKSLVKAPPAQLNDTLASALSEKYAPAPAVSQSGQLNVGGLLQVWYYSIQKDRKALFNDGRVHHIADTNEASDNDSFRIRRADLRFTLYVNEHIQGYVALDPARDATSFPSFPSNQGLFKRLPNSNTGSVVSGVQTGSGGAPRILQDAYILYKEILPHHDFQIGQFKPPFDEEGTRLSSLIDFSERSFIGQLGDLRDLGAHIRGYWFDERLQYWAGAFDGAGNYYGSSGQQQNRSDDNDSKDFIFKLLGRPVWNDGVWGSLELGGAAQFGRHGESGGPNPIDHPVTGLNREKTFASRHTGYVYYAPGGDLKGLWLRANYLWLKDRNAPGSVSDPLNRDTKSNATQDNGNPFSSQAWNASIGYKLGDGPCAGSLPEFARKLEVALRYEWFQNVQVANPANLNRTSVYATRVYTAGVNYYIVGNTKIQFNYNHVLNPESRDPRLVFHQVRNDSILVNFQVAF